MSDSISLDGETIAVIQDSVLQWFNSHRRLLPWRTEPRDAYHVWLAEIMLQQTQVGTVTPYYERWLQRFPTLDALATAPLDDVLKQWEGLGYYTRARNLHKAAQIVTRDNKGIVPDSVERLMLLPGIGRSTAGAIASLAYKIDAPILDGNVVRILCRLTAFSYNPRSTAAQKVLWDLIQKLLPQNHAGQFNESLMDIGATVCTPRTPDCQNCPVQHYCIAYAKGTPESYPVRAVKSPVPHKHIATAFIRDASEAVLLAQRPAHGLLGGLWELPGVEFIMDPYPGAANEYDAASAHLAAYIHRVSGLHIQVSADDFMGTVKHAFTHFRITRHVAIVTLTLSAPKVQPIAAYTNLRWVKPAEVRDLALTRSDHKIIELIKQLFGNTQQ